MNVYILLCTVAKSENFQLRTLCKDTKHNINTTAVTVVLYTVVCN